MTTKVIAFDLFGTVFDPIFAKAKDRAKYIERMTAKSYEKMRLPKAWQKLPAFPDAKDGIALLRNKFKVVTCSNWDFETTVDCLSFNNIDVDYVVDISWVRAYKPKLVTYAHICDVMQVEPGEVLFVTGNKGGPDNTGAPEKIGMKTILIRHGWPNTITELAGEMGC